MNKFLCFLIFVLSFFSIHAQSQDSQEKVQILIQRVDSLEHELSYLKLTYELNMLNSDISIFTNEVYSKSIGIQLNLYTRNFDSRLYESYDDYYESCQSKKNQFLNSSKPRKSSSLLRL